MLDRLAKADPRRYLIALGLVLGLALIPTMIMSFVIDPYGMNGLFDLGIDKRAVAYPLNYRLYKLAAFRRQPGELVVFGDSRADALQERWFAEAGVPYFNFSYPGGTLLDEIRTFWWAAHRTRLRVALFSIPFNMYTDGDRQYADFQARILDQSLALVDNPWAYYQSSFVRRVSWRAVQPLIWRSVGAAATAREPPTSAPPSAEARWNKALDMVNGTYSDWKQPKSLQAKLEQVRRYCVDRKIQLVFFLPPNQVDLQRKVDQFGLTGEYATYKAYLGNLGTVFDYDVSSAITRDRKNYADPFHVREDTARWLVRDLIAHGLPK